MIPWWRRKDVARIVMPPPLLFFLYLFAAWGADFLCPAPLDWFPLGARAAAGGTLTTLALALGIWTFMAMRRAKTPVEPWEPTVRIVTTGPFSCSRNPMYIALTAVSLSIAGALGSAWYFLGSLALFAILHFGVVLKEEEYLLAKFGDEYAAYLTRVRRWI